MKNTLTLATLATIGTLLLVGCGRSANPADRVVPPDAATLQQQKDFDQAMIEQSRNAQSKK